MVSNSGPGTRSNAPRNAARAHLLALRTARLKRRRCAEVTSSKTASADPGPIISDIFSSDMSQDTMLAQPETAERKNLSYNDGSFDDNIAIPAHDHPTSESASDPCAPEINIEAAIHPEESVPDALETMEETVGVAEATSQEQKEDATELGILSLSRTTEALSCLPGSGPGLIWVLNKAGIMSLEDLATANKVDLSKKMGLLGEILDLDYWISEAGSMIETDLR